MPCVIGFVQLLVSLSKLLVHIERIDRPVTAVASQHFGPGGIADIEREVMSGSRTPADAARELLTIFRA